MRQYKTSCLKMYSTMMIHQLCVCVCACVCRYCEEMVPLNACLRLVSNCEQTLSSHTSRRLITMEKIKEPEETDALAHLSDPHFSPYQGHNAFREKYFSGISKRTLTGKEETNKMAANGGK
uniref:Uncharacterized protein n=1 Tax=Hucho hucho TaxID=62062 RepID=A0A4W5L9J9_9TELE